MHYFYGKVNWGRVVCPLYGGSPYLGESVMGGSIVYTHTHTLTHTPTHSHTHDVMHTHTLTYILTPTAYRW